MDAAAPLPARRAARPIAQAQAVSFGLAALPALWLAAQWLCGALGINPLERLLHFTGRWALIMLLVTLAVTPVRRASVWLSRAAHTRWGKRLSDWNWLIRLRRQFGLWAFFYATLHGTFYATLDAAGEISAVAEDLRERPYIVLGGMAWLLLVPLAATSNSFAIRSLGRRWRQLHTLAYVAPVLGLAHQLSQAKVGDHSAWPYALMLAPLLGARLWAWRRGDQGELAQPRASVPKPLP